MYLQCHPQGCIEAFQVVKGAIFQLRVNASVNQLYGAFNQRFIPWPINSCRQNGGGIVFGKAGKLGVDDRFIFTPPGNGRPQVVRNNDLRNSFKEMQSVFAGLDQILFLLGSNRFFVSKLAASQDSHEHFNENDYSIFVHDGEFFTSEVDEHLFSGFVLDVHHRMGLTQVHVDVIVETRTAKTPGVLFKILPVQLFTGNALSLELLTYPRKEQLQLLLAFALGCIWLGYQENGGEFFIAHGQKRLITDTRTVVNL